jgi:hypothetical protein
VRKYHTLLHGIFARAVRDRILANPAAHTELPKVITRRLRVLTPEDFDRLLANIPAPCPNWLTPVRRWAGCARGTHG